ADIVARNLEGLETLRARFGELVIGEDRRIYEGLVTEIEEVGADGSLAHRLITLRFLDQLLELRRVGKETGAAPADAARAFYRLSDLLGVPWLRQAIFESATDDRWEQRAARALADDLSRAHHKLVAQVMRSRSEAPDIDRAADRLIEAR